MAASEQQDDDGSIAGIEESTELRLRGVVGGPSVAGATVRAYDPEGMDAARRLMPDIVYTDSAYAAAEGACAVVIVTEWDAFRALDLKRLRRIMAQPVLVDLRNIYRPDAVEGAGFTYCGVGRPGHAKPSANSEATPADATVD